MNRKMEEIIRKRPDGRSFARIMKDCMLETVNEAIGVKNVYHVDPNKNRSFVNFADGSKLRISAE